MYFDIPDSMRNRIPMLRVSIRKILVYRICDYVSGIALQPEYWSSRNSRNVALSLLRATDNIQGNKGITNIVLPAVYYRQIKACT